MGGKRTTQNNHPSHRPNLGCYFTHLPLVCQDSLFGQEHALSQGRPQARKNQRRTLSGMLRIASSRERRWRSFSVVPYTKAGRGAYATGCPMRRSSQPIIISSHSGALFKRTSMPKPAREPTTPMIAEASPPSGSSC